MNPLIKPLLGILLISATLFAATAQQIIVRPTVAQKWADPAEKFGRFFADVQLKAVFPDSKTFADCTPKASVGTIMSAYELARMQPGFNLKAFVLQYFTLPVTPASGYVSKSGQSAQAHINALWPVLTRPAEKIGQPIGSRIPLPKAYVVPGGRFSEIYYWDSYFTMLGLQQSGKTGLIQNMADNFAYLIDTFGFIPNGSRTYYLGRSQPNRRFSRSLSTCSAKPADAGRWSSTCPSSKKNTTSGWMERRSSPSRMPRIGASYACPMGPY